MACMFCTHCGGCKLGTMTAGQAREGVCFMCGEPVDPGQKVCPKCGAPYLYYQSSMKGFGLRGTSAWKPE